MENMEEGKAMIRVQEVDAANIHDLFVGCVLDEPEYTRARDESAEFFLWMKSRNWRGFVAYENGAPVGRVEIAPIEESFAQLRGENLYVLPCLNVLPEKRGKGVGRALIMTVLEETEDRDGVVTWTVENWMPSSFFKKFGFVELKKKNGISVLGKSHGGNIQVSWFEPEKRFGESGRAVNVDVVLHKQCPYVLANYRILAREASQFGKLVKIEEHLSQNRKDIERLGDMAFYIDGASVLMGPDRPERVRSLIMDRLACKGLHG
jgi:GNAT superfamily N-acetyltransferase